jgi:hypothetical protein
MSTQNGQVCPKCNADNIANATRNVSKTTKLVTSGEVEMLEFLNFLNRTDLVNALKLIHDCASYHSSVSLDIQEKTALYDMSVLWEKMEGMIA